MHIYVYTYINIYIYTRLAIQINRDRKDGTYENTDSTNGLILFPFLADQTESSFVEKINKYVYIYVCIHTYI